jgi:hypothetical protein
VGFGCLFGLGFGSGLVVRPPVSVADGFGDLEVEEGRRRVWGAATAQPRASGWTVIRREAS